MRRAFLQASGAGKSPLALLMVAISALTACKALLSGLPWAYDALCKGNLRIEDADSVGSVIITTIGDSEDVY